MTAPTGRSSNPYATYVDLDAAEQPQNVYPQQQQQPPPPTYAPPPPPPPVAYFLPPEKPRRAGLRTSLKAVGSLVVILLVLGGFSAVRGEFRQKSQACDVITRVAGGLQVPAGAAETHATAEQGAAFLNAQMDAAEVARQRREDAHNRGFARDLFLHPALKAALIGIADDLDALMDLREQRPADAAERAAKAGDSLIGHVQAARAACR